MRKQYKQYDEDDYKPKSSWQAEQDVDFDGGEWMFLFGAFVTFFAIFIWIVGSQS